MLRVSAIRKRRYGQKSCWRGIHRSLAREAIADRPRKATGEDIAGWARSISFYNVRSGKITLPQMWQMK